MSNYGFHTLGVGASRRQLKKRSRLGSMSHSHRTESLDRMPSFIRLVFIRGGESADPVLRA